jgi:hypothetical protein
LKSIKSNPSISSSSSPSRKSKALLFNSFSSVLLKLDIEGSEKEVFEKNYETWLPNTKMLIIEVHDHMRKGAAKSVFAAMNKYNFSFSMNQEKLIFINQDF